MSSILSQDLLTIAEVSKKLKIGVRTIWRWVAIGRFPQPILISKRAARWRPEDIERFLQKPN